MCNKPSFAVLIVDVAPGLKSLEIPELDMYIS